MAHAQAATARQQRRASRLLWGIAALVLAMIGYVTWKDYDVASPCFPYWRDWATLSD